MNENVSDYPGFSVKV